MWHRRPEAGTWERAIEDAMQAMVEESGNARRVRQLARAIEGFKEMQREGEVYPDGAVDRGGKPF